MHPASYLDTGRVWTAVHGLPVEFLARGLGPALTLTATAFHARATGARICLP